jgi:biopolymer transport protein ExbB
MSLLEFIDKGGFIMYILLFANIVGYALILYKGWLIWKFKTDFSHNGQSIWSKFTSKMTGKSFSDEGSVALLKEEVVQNIKELEPGLSTIRTIATTGPLLGLLGTVIGILDAFFVISKTGLTDPSMFADGISLALITTVGGLVVAIPHLVAYNYFVSILDNLESKMQDLVISFYTNSKGNTK